MGQLIYVIHDGEGIPAAFATAELADAYAGRSRDRCEVLEVEVADALPPYYEMLHARALLGADGVDYAHSDTWIKGWEGQLTHHEHELKVYRRQPYRHTEPHFLEILVSGTDHDRVKMTLALTIDTAKADLEAWLSPESEARTAFIANHG